jgi:DNA-binding beta-propeller fold protein YncE
MSDGAGKLDKAASTEWAFVYDVTQGQPRQLQALPAANADQGLAWSPDGHAFYVSGGGDDVIHVFASSNGAFAETDPPIKLGHMVGLGIADPPEGAVPPDRRGHESETKPVVAGIAIDPTGKWLLAANFQNDSVTLVDLARPAVAADLDLRPGKSNPRLAGVAGGEYPIAVAWAGAAKAYVASQRDREIVVLDLSHAAPRVAGRIKLAGQPVALRVNRANSRLYAAVDNTDTIDVIDTQAERVIEVIPALGPSAVFSRVKGYRGVNPNSLVLSPDETSLFVSEGGVNAAAVVALSPAARGVKPPIDSDNDGDGDDSAPPGSRVIGMLPTGWYPNAVAVSKDGHMLFVVNGKSVAGPNPGACRSSSDVTPGPKACNSANQYVLQLQTSSLAAVPLTDSSGLAAATLQVASNMGLGDAQSRAAAEAVMAEISRRIHHVIYVIKENRGYDQVLGDLPVGNGDPRLTLFPAPITPNHHALAAKFVTLDSFYDSGEVSGVGWNWSTAARTTDFTEKTVPLNYAGRGLQYDWEGENRNINVALGRAARKKSDSAIADDPDLLPGSTDVAAPDSSPGAKPGQGEAGAGYLWDAAIRAKLTLRNYGFYVDIVHYGAKARNRVLPVAHPFADHVVQATSAKVALAAVTDPYFRGFDQAYADFWRFQEWKREFDQYQAKGDLPALSLVRLAHDHFGDFADAADGLGTVDGQMADNDYALGMLVEAVAASRFKNDTLIFVIEDDAQNAADHIDAHRSIAFVAGPYVKQGVVVSERFNTVNMLRTIEAVLKLPPLGLNDALAAPMASVFDLKQSGWSFTASIPAVLRSSTLPLPAEPVKHAGDGCFETPRRDVAWWTRAMRGQDFSGEDRLDTARFNLALWRGLKGAAPLPVQASGRDLSDDRANLLAATPGCR